MSTVLFAACSGCSNTKEEQVGSIADSTLNVNHLIALDKQKMYLKYQDGTYRWFETGIILKEYLDGETDGTPEMVVNVFQTVIGDSLSFDTQVYKMQHFDNGTFAEDSIKGFWIEDFPLVDSLIKVPYDSAFNLVMQVNLPKPHSKNVVLRTPIGPKACNPQWVFGNINSQLWLDAVDGTIRTSNPAFPEGEGFKMPLGEWP